MRVWETRDEGIDMKKKIAMFANEWNNENVCRFLEGMDQVFPKDFADIFCFVAANSYGRPDDANTGECSIHFLPNLKDFDYAVIFSQGLNSNEVRDKIYAKCEEAGITTICIGDKHEGFYSLVVDNEIGMRQLCEHLYEKHNARTFHFIAGARENEDSNIRLRVLTEFLKEKGLSLREEDIFYSEWETNATIFYTEDRYRQKSFLPDAIIVANDFLAVGTCVGLEKNGLKVPGDVAVTGFDYSQEGLHYFPSIASVDQHFDELGKKTVEIMLKHEKGEPVDSVTVINSEYMPGESCGCPFARDEDTIRKAFCHHQIDMKYQNNARYSRLVGIRNAICESNRYVSLPEKVKEVFMEKNPVEGDTVHFLMDPSFESVAHEGVVKMPKFQYTDYMQVIVSKEDGVMNNAKYCSNSELIPGYNGERPGNLLYLFTPLYIETYVFGYFVLKKDNLSNIYWDFHEYSDCLLNAFKYYKTSIELTALNDRMSDLMQTDALTSLKNRAAYESAKAALKRNYLAGDDTPFAVIMFDVNNLKTINDDLGHGAGDVYIKNSSELICNTFKHSPVYRIGGDEFVAIAKKSDYEARHELLSDFRSKISELQKPGTPKLKAISVASGMADFEEISDGGFELLFQKADERMYDNKREMKTNAIR